jgi:uncharacterized membrane-anchored protein
LKIHSGEKVKNMQAVALDYLQDQQQSSDSIRMRLWLLLLLIIWVISVSLEFTREPGSEVDEVEVALNG